MKIFRKLLVFLLVFMSVITAFNGKLGQVFSAKAENSESEIVIEKISGRILYEKNADQKKYPASTTKILTAITVIENVDLNKEIKVTEKTVGIEGSSIYLEKGEILTVKDLLYGLMLRSGNDCAETLALTKNGVRDDFIKLMNETAVKAGAKNSNFTNPHGLHDDNHYTTARDLALISRYAMNNQTFREIVGTKTITIPFSTRNTKRRLINKNKLLFNLDGCTGIKTGYTKKSGRCLVSSYKKDGMELICVVLNCPPMFERSEELLTTFSSQYKLYKLFESDEIVDFLETDGDDKCGIYIKNDVILPLTETENKNIKIKYDYPKKISGVKKDSEIGEIKFFIENNLLFSEKVYTIIDA